MATDGWPDWLPSGWTMQISKISERTVKCYLDPEGKKFYSKPQVFKHLNITNNSTANEKTQNADGSTGDVSLEPDVPHQNEVPESTPRGRTTRRATGSNSKKSTQTVGYVTGDGPSSEPNASQKDGVSGWLPDGWSIELKTRGKGSRPGMQYKCYVESASGRKFFSKPQVLNYLGNTNSSAAGKRKGYRSIMKPHKLAKLQVTKARNNKGKKKKESVRMSSDYEVISRNPVDGLPPGWIKEIRMRKNTALKKKDPYYLDPSSDYVFFSKLDALRYLNTGDIKKCAMKPLQRGTNEGHLDGDNLTGEKLASLPDSSKGNKTPEVLPNGCAADLETTEVGMKYKERVGSLTGKGSSSQTRASRHDNASEWLPDGWTVEVKTRDTGSNIGMKFKCYTEPGSGRKFYSKPQVLNYLAGGTNSVARKSKVHANTGVKSSSETDASWNSDVGHHKRSKKKKKSNQRLPFNEVVTKSPADGLPPGWIKEIRTRKYSTHERSDPYYMDPLSGYIFRSKLDALRYLETGDVGKCAIKPTKRDINGKETVVGENDGGTPVDATIRKQLFEENKGGKQDGNEATDPKTAEKTSVSTPPNRKITKTPKRYKSSAPLPGRSSKRLKGLEPETKNNPVLKDGNGHMKDNGAVQEKQVTGANLEKQTNDGMFNNELGDSSWTDQFDFAVKTLTGEIPVQSVQEESVAIEAGLNVDVNENPANLN